VVGIVTGWATPGFSPKLPDPFWGQVSFLGVKRMSGVRLRTGAAVPLLLYMPSYCGEGRV